MKNVQVRAARAEALPFAVGRFDAVIGTFFLQFTDLPMALSEAVRVTRSGGTVVFAVFNKQSLGKVVWFREWFAPVFSLAERFGIAPSDLLHERGEVPAAMRQAGMHEVEVLERTVAWVGYSPESVLLHVMEGVSFFAAVTRKLPWAAREELMQELLDRGRAICDKTTVQQRTIAWPVEFVRGKVGNGG